MSETLSPPITDLLDYLAASPTPFHAAANAAVRLEAAGFRPLELAESWSDLSPGGYVVHHGDSALVAFVLPKETPRSVRIVGAHTDSPNLRLKPHGEYTKEGYCQLGVEVYGGMLLNSWLDRDLGVAGRVVARNAAGGLETRFVRLEKPLCRVAQLAIHLDREVNEKGLVLNKQEHLAPIVGMAGVGDKPLLRRVAEAAHVSADALVSMDLMLFDVAPPAIGGDAGEFIFSARLDNLAMCHASTSALLLASKDDRAEGLVPMIALFDHEEVGSDSASGAGAPILERVIERIALARGVADRDGFYQLIARSVCISADMAHAVHPNYADKSEQRHKVVLGGGPVIKVNSNQRYATSAKTGALFQELCRRVEVPVQQYAHRTDLACGSTIGPITATRLGIATVDVGNPMLSMHSIREMCGVQDHEPMIRVQRAFFGTSDLFL